MSMTKEEQLFWVRVGGAHLMLIHDKSPRHELLRNAIADAGERAILGGPQRIGDRDRAILKEVVHLWQSEDGNWSDPLIKAFGNATENVEDPQ